MPQKILPSLKILKVVVISALLLSIVLFTGLAAQRTNILYLNGDEEDNGEGGVLFLPGEDSGEELGEIAWNLGVPAILAFVIAREAYIWSARRGVKWPVSYNTILIIHIISALVLGFMALLHGIANIGRATPLEYALGVLIALLLLSGATLYLGRGRRGGRIARLIHAQRLLAIALLLLAGMHVVAVD
ncbi:hypothetical protein [Aeropyrum camini]|uniref:Uncharacterized protein n=1 Tax=Aeropyrum camini SY1 = JCM 12091 TaxID=1198449 RepID=U3TC05_9CREN|nr:hypothetical protein [Aeropyrum camini]BAN89478.1 hypothetical protein ACAM_0009 [Aeropyrum camini SY1 = JCM 12091]